MSRDMMYILKGDAREDVSEFITLIMDIPKLAFKNKTDKFKKVEDYNIMKWKQLMRLYIQNNARKCQYQA